MYSVGASNNTFAMDSNVNTSVVNVSDGQMVPPVVSGVAVGSIDSRNVLAFAPGVTLPPFVPGATLPVPVVSGVAVSGGGGLGVVPPAFATTVA
ncbi:hypothetical protein LIER_09998 [Lithospermum erythrorhizon]|uniref:Uncharacterized protein n=1 Tax=Lithospermum erythrorhizon TaxID=34254 RepID=A0AAV3PHN4_LITER